MKIHASLLLAALLCACGDSESSGGGGEGATGGRGGAGAGASNGGSSDGGTSDGGGAPTDLDDLLARLRADRDATLLDESYVHGWPVAVEEGLVVVSTDPTLSSFGGDFSEWAPVALTADEGFSWGLLPAEPAQRYKLADGAGTFAADPWARAYAYDDFGEISLVPGPEAHLERFFEVGAGASSLEPRTVRVWLPEGRVTHVLFVHDGQNLFDPEAIWGGWRLDESAPAGMMLVGIDNTAARMDEYTQVPDDIGEVVGGLGDEYAALVEEVVRPLVADQYGEPAVVGTMGSSLGGLISLHIGLTYPDRYDFIASLSGTLGWGSIGAHTGETLIERYEAAGLQPFTVYLDSGGDGPCADTDGDGIQDDGDGSDNYCETVQMRDVLAADGWVFDETLFHWHEPGAEHNEQAWADRVFRPLGIFAAM
ncbi:MAG: alpha/beta hydrolase [Polyangiaceae bacterium]|nr:alpha/beta hydrolase [Polyangiaceae bacterium]